jgi:hypothetical protein
MKEQENCGELYHPDVFNNREEVIVFKREEFASVKVINYNFFCFD